MGIKSFLLAPFFRYTQRQVGRWANNAVRDQQKIFDHLVTRARDTRFGKDHHFAQIRSYKDFTQAVPIRDYEGLKNYIDMICQGREDVLWPGRPRFFAKTSGTTSGAKYIPLTNASIPNHIGTARTALFNYCGQTDNGRIFDGKMIFLSGSPTLTRHHGIPTGRLSGIVNHLVPRWIRSNQMPGEETNRIEDWEHKLDRIVSETVDADMRLISGIPPWVKMYYERLLDTSGEKDIKSLFPDFGLFVYGGVNFDPYRQQIEALTGGHVDSLETYPASEGFIAFQDQWPHSGLLLNTRSGIFFEFVPAGEIYHANPTRLSLQDVKPGVQYALIINNNAGLWAYNIGDTVAFDSINPYRLRVTGRIKHFISAFGEHVIGKEVETAMAEVTKACSVNVTEFTVAPQVSPPGGGLPYHEWFVETSGPVADPGGFADQLNALMVRQNIYYNDLIKGKVLRPLVVRFVPQGTFERYMKSLGRLGGQNKLPRLSNDRKIADALTPLLSHRDFD